MKTFIVKPIGKDLFEGLSLEGKPEKIKKIAHYPVLTTEELKGARIYLLLKPHTFFYEVYTFSLPIFNPKVIKLRLRERINTLGYFTKPFEICWKVLERKGEFFKIAYLALESEELTFFRTLLRDTLQCKLERIVFLPLALSAYYGNLEQISLLLHREKEGIWITATKKGLPLIVEFLPVDELLGPNFEEMARRLSFLKNLMARDFQEEVQSILTNTSEIKEGLEQLNIGVELLSGEYPEFLGIFKVDEALDFLPEEERAIKRVLEFNKKISYPLIGLALIFLISGLGLRQINHSLEREIQHKEGLLHETLNKLISEYSEAKLTAFINYVEEKKQLQKIPQADKILISIANSLPGTKITLLEVKQAQPPQQAQGPGGPQFSYTILIEGEKQAPPQDINAFAQELTKDLKGLLKSIETKFDYVYGEGKIKFQIKGTI